MPSGCRAHATGSAAARYAGYLPCGSARPHFGKYLLFLQMNLRILAQTFSWLTILLVIAASVSGISRFRRLLPSQRHLTLLACFDATIELTAKFLSQVVHLKSNLFLFPIVLTGEVALLALLYRRALQSPVFTKVLPWIVGLFGLYALLDYLAPHTAVHYAPGVQVVSYLLILGMAGLYFRKLLNDLQLARLSQEPVFLLSVGLTIYSLGSLLIALFSNYIIAHYSRTTQIIVIDGIRNLFNVELYACYIAVLWMPPPKANSLSS